MTQPMLKLADEAIASGNEAERAGRLLEACERYREAARIAPGYAKAHLNLGIGLQATGDALGAMASYREALARHPGEAFASYNLGRLLYLRGELNEAEDLLRQALAGRARFPEARIMLAVVLQGKQQHAAALAELAEVLRQQPDDLAALRHQAHSLRSLDRLEQAQAALKRVVELAPEDTEARAELSVLHARLSDHYLARGDLRGAVAQLEALLTIRPDWSDALFNYGCALKRLTRPVEAEAAFRRALSIDPAHGAAYSMLGAVLREQCRTEEALAVFRTGRQHCPANLDLASAELYVLTGAETAGDAELYEKHVAFGGAIESAYPPRFEPPRNTPDPERRLRIGYVSADFRYHVVTLFMLPTLEHRNRKAVEVYCYSTTEAPDQYTRMLAAHADAWRDCSKISEQQLAERIHADQIDILVDLAGHSGTPQLRVFAQRPAPIQATWLGYLGTTGMTRMHYRISDPVADPPGLTERYHVETLARLPHSQWCYRPFIAMPASRTPPCVENGYVTFGSFNQAAKISPSTRRLWGQILERLPDARLTIAGVPQGRAQEDLLRDLAAAGVAGDRLTLLPYVSLEDYFRSFNRVDIALDTMPYSGGTTTCDALWMGVPVITAPGTRSASRSAASILATAGLPDWIAASPDDYVRSAVMFARNIELLSRIRGSLRQRLQASPLMDEARFAADLEDLYRNMWRRWCAAAH